LKQGGLAPGGLNFDAKVRRESVDIEDMFIAHIGSMDTFARGLLNAVKLQEQGTLSGFITERYSSWNSALGKSVEKGTCDFGKLEAYALKQKDQEPKTTSGKQERCELLFNAVL